MCLVYWYISPLRNKSSANSPWMRWSVSTLSSLDAPSTYSSNNLISKPPGAAVWKGAMQRVKKSSQFQNWIVPKSWLKKFLEERVPALVLYLLEAKQNLMNQQNGMFWYKMCFCMFMAVSNTRQALCRLFVTWLDPLTSVSQSLLTNSCPLLDEVANRGLLSAIRHLLIASLLCRATEKSEDPLACRLFIYYIFHH